MKGFFEKSPGLVKMALVNQVAAPAMIGEGLPLGNLSVLGEPLG